MEAVSERSVGKGGKTTRVQQGTKEYVESILEQISDNNPALAQKISNQLNSDKLRYMMVRQPFDSDCGPPVKGTAGQAEVSEFELGNGNTQCP